MHESGERVLCQTRCPELDFGKQGHLNNGTVFEVERERSRDGGKGVQNQVTKEARLQLGRSELHSGSAVTKGNSASAHAGVKPGFFPKPGTSTRAALVQMQAKWLLPRARPPPRTT